MYCAWLDGRAQELIWFVLALGNYWEVRYPVLRSFSLHLHTHITFYLYPSGLTHVPCKLGQYQTTTKDNQVQTMYTIFVTMSAGVLLWQSAQKTLRKKFNAFIEAEWHIYASVYKTIIGSDNCLSAKFYLCLNMLTLKHRETHGCVVSTVATDALVLNHQAISIHIILDQFHIKIFHIRRTASENEITFWKKWPSHLCIISHNSITAYS